jgi:hypothetical protein
MIFGIHHSKVKAIFIERKTRPEGEDIAAANVCSSCVESWIFLSAPIIRYRMTLMGGGGRRKFPWVHEALVFCAGWVEGI